MNWGDWVLSFGFFAISLATGLFACALVKRLGVEDAPDGQRKNQSQPVPRLGGLAIFVATLVGTALSFLILILAYGANPIDTFAILLTQAIDPQTGFGLVFAFVLLALLIGLWDDIWTANTKLKLLILSIAAIGVATLGLSANAFDTPFGSLKFPLFLIVGSAAWLLVITNAANFMDGSNGLAVGSLGIMLASLAAIGGFAGNWGFSVWWFPLFGAIMAFLMHNLRGTLYAGDAGALGLGALFAAFSLASGLDIWTVATLALPFLIDILLTLIWRARQGRNWLEAHLDHAYQRLIDDGWSHLETAVLYWGLCAVAGAMAYIGALAGGAAPFLIFWTLWIALSWIWVRHRRTAKRSNLGG